MPVWVFRSFFYGLGPLRARALGGPDPLCFGVEWLFECFGVCTPGGREARGVNQIDMITPGKYNPACRFVFVV